MNERAHDRGGAGGGGSCAGAGAFGAGAGAGAALGWTGTVGAGLSGPLMPQPATAITVAISTTHVRAPRRSK
jgi:hypothetical protein